ncbi:MAG TPA: DUF192 domain-containing protein, partial [Rubrobacter sp.]|nr:DUF192 domain-containing protein [Rubrobacter sp.]
MKIWKTGVVALVALLLAGCGGAPANSDTQSKDTQQASGANTAETTTSDLRTLVIDTSGGKKVEVRVEVADNVAEQEKGLMYRKSLGEDRGMLFVYPAERELSYWMRNTYIPLSIAYIDSEGRIVDILDMKPLDDNPPHYTSSEPVQYALEVNKGFFEKEGVKEGDHAEL